MIPTLAEQREAWSSPPIDDVGYVPASEMLRWSDGELRFFFGAFERARYKGWRNHNGLWRDMLGLDSTHNKWVLDYGCGAGLEALQYARAGNHVWLTDIAPHNVLLAARVLRLHGYEPWGITILGDDEYDKFSESFEIIHCAGVLHHIPDPISVVKRMHEWLCFDGELRLMLYSDQGWRMATGTDPPNDVTTHPARERFVRFFDAVGDWADWYNRDRLESRFGQWFDVVRCEYITPDDRYLAAVLRRKD